MKNLFILLVALVPFFSMADSWDNLTLDQANKVKAYLEKNPYILDYCDCCSSSNAFLVKVTSVDIVPCEWQEGDYSVKVIVERIAEIPISDERLNIASTQPVDVSDYIELTISMNYTWILSDKNKKALPFYDAVPYKKYSRVKEGSGTCVEASDYPSPKKVRDKKYKKWFKKKMK